MPHTTDTETQSQNNAMAALVIVAARLSIGLLAAKIAFTFFRHGPWIFPLNEVNWLSLFNHWDSVWYIGIAQSGYSSLMSHAFYPVYPLLIRVCSPIFGYMGATLAVSWLAAVFAVWGVIDISQRFASARSSWMAGFLLAWNPVSIFFIAGYPESILVATMVWSLRFCLDRRWMSAALLAAVSSAIMPQGIVAAIVVSIAIMTSERRWKVVLKAMVYGAIGESGIILYLIYCFITTGSVLVSLKAEKIGWDNHITYPFHMLVAIIGNLLNGIHSSNVVAVDLVNLMSGIIGIIVLGISVIMILKDRQLVLPVVLLTLGVLVSMSTIDQSLQNSARFTFFQAPLYIIGAVLIDKVAKSSRMVIMTHVVAITVAVSLFYGALFTNGWWLT